MRHDVYRDKDGNPVTITVEQMYALLRGLDVVEAVRKEAGYPSLFEYQTPRIELSKSRLLGRMLIDGRPPLNEAPPTYLSARGYHFVEPDLPHYYLGQVFMATVQDGVITEVHVPKDPA